ncbi:DUF86 domain-containing protein [Dulcicalothrix desertica PCC 7102]|uniref:DUF86 domain-containing protein n=1 Tax=Dulcicalothrix desertica PCC 7102 TaxID=232991 RepID=A0A433VP64_9CYAN|nr:DUF86 domain-containing protein [Dulcicalothrix desertica]RUT07887.1 DUF86 domain-containing protein [Dulcicalothrix desertica PCC 7102]TWH39408.1 uncharacterized protein with HEPN domain [Dulcicalothrix desertica PCC 7102]
MPSRKLKQRIQDILDIGAEIEAFTQDMSFTDFQQDTRTIKAVLYNVAVIGEAAASLMPEAEVDYPEIPWVDIRGLRNIVIHEYFRVNIEIIWETIQRDLPPLLEQLQELQSRLNS